LTYGQERKAAAARSDKDQHEEPGHDPRRGLAGAGLKVGDRLRADVSGPGRIILVWEDDPLERLAVALTGIHPEGYLDDLRREWT
jgi:hypothetical protein